MTRIRYAPSMLLLAFMLVASLFVALPAYAVDGVEDAVLATQADTVVAIANDAVTPETTELQVDIGNLPEGGMLSVKAFGAADEVAYDKGAVLKFLVSPAASNNVAIEAQQAGTRIAAFVIVAGECVAASEPVVVAQAAPAVQTTVAVAPLKEGDTTATVTLSGMPDGAMVAIKAYDAGATEFLWSTGDALKVMNAYTGAPVEGENVVSLTEALQAGTQVVALVMTGYSDDAIVATSEPVTVQAAGGQDAPTRQQVIDACSVSMASPNAEGDAAGKFKLSDNSAQLKVTLHESIDFARLTVYAYPKAASFDPDNVSFNKSLFSTMVRDGEAVSIDEVTADFEGKLAALDTAYNLVAYLYFLVPSESGDDYQYVTSQGFEVVDDNGQTTQKYTYPKASIVETELPTGATSMHVSLTGDERLFQLARETEGNALADRFSIHFVVVEYDASIDNFDMGEDSYTALYSEEATEAFENKEVELREPLAKGMKVRALSYWTQYTGDAAAIPVPKGVDYQGLDSEAIVVTDGAAPIVSTPKVSIDGSVTTATTAFDVTAKNLPENALMFVQAFPAGADVSYMAAGYENLAVFSPYAGTAPVNGANAVTLDAALEEGVQVAAFVLAGGEVVAQSQVVTVAAAAQPAGDVAIVTNPITASTEKVVVRIGAGIPEGTAVLLKSFEQDAAIAYDAGQAHGYFATVAAGDNELTLTNADQLATGGVLVAFLLNAGKVLGQSEPVSIDRAAALPEATIGLDGADVELTQGDKFIGLTWSVDAQASDVSYVLYQFTGDELDESTATALSRGAITVSKWNHYGATSVSLGGKLIADAKLQLVLTADGVKGYSNVMTVGATPAWAKVTPTVSIDQSAVKSDARSIKLAVDYPEEYTSLGKEFFCNVTVYQYPGSYTDDDFEDKELDENSSIAKVVAGVNSSAGQTNGSLELAIGENVQLVPGYRLIAKIRLPQAERQDHDSMWEDYLSWSVPVVSADAQIPGEMVMLYNLGPDTAKGEKMDAICEQLGLEVVHLGQEDLVKQVGAIAGYAGYDEIFDDYAADNPTVEYMLMANLSEASVDRLLAAMAEQGVSIGAKGVLTETNKQWALGRLIVDIAEEHETITALVDLQQLVKAAEALDADAYGSVEAWEQMQQAIAAAKALYGDDASDEPTAEQLNEARAALEAAYLAVAGLAKLDGQVAITATEQEDGSYTLSAAVEGASVEGLSYDFTWNDKAKTTGAALSGVAADAVGGRIVTVTADGAYGKLTGQLRAPGMPANVMVSANSGQVDVSWDAVEAATNQPAATAYTAELYRGATLVKKHAGSGPFATFEGLDAGTYLVKVYAQNIAGRSDKAVEEVIVEAAQATGAAKADNPVKVTSKAKKKSKALKVKVGKKKSFAAKKAFTVKNAQGKVTYKKVKGNKKITVSSQGKITVKKGLKKGVYTIKVNVTAAGNAQYKAKTVKNVVVKVRVS